MTGFKENCSFFPSGTRGQCLYGAIYLPQDNLAATGLVIVPPIGRERLRCYHETANLARSLAANGVPVLRFDYRGEGESSGDFAHSTISSRVEDIVTAVEQLKRRSGVDQVCLLGLRLGGLLAVMAAEQAGIQRMILCDPVGNPSSYARDLLRANIVLQSQYFGEVFKKEAALRQDLQRGETVSVYGFHLSQAFLQQLETLDPGPHLASFAGKAVILYMSARRSPPKKDAARMHKGLCINGQCEIRCVEHSFSWGSRRLWRPRLEPLNQAVAQWMGVNCQ